MNTINLGDTVRHNTRPHITGIVTTVTRVGVGLSRDGVWIAGHRGPYSPDNLTVTTPAVQQSRQAAAADALAAAPVEAVLAGDDGWWDVAADGDGEWHVYPADAATFGLEVRVQVRRARP